MSAAQPGEFNFFSMGVKPGEKVFLYVDGQYVGDVKFTVSNSQKRLAWKVSKRLVLGRVRRQKGNRNSRRRGD